MRSLRTIRGTFSAIAEKRCARAIRLSRRPALTESHSVSDNCFSISAIMKRSASSSPVAKKPRLSAASPSQSPQNNKKKKTGAPRPAISDYHSQTPVRDGGGGIIWPAPSDQINAARALITECAAAGRRTLIVPDKDADGLSAGAILRKTLLLLGLDESLIAIHLVSKGRSVHDEDERAAMAALRPDFVFVLDQGSRRSPPIVAAHPTVSSEGDKNEDQKTKVPRTLIIDHHWAPTPQDFPESSSHVTACHSPPVATASLLTYHICSPLHDAVPDSCAWLCVVGTHGDLGNTLKWQPPFPDMAATFKTHTKKRLNDAVSLLNAPRRTAEYNVRSAWDALALASSSSSSSGGGGGPASIVSDPALLRARASVNAEVERHARAPPRFSRDCRVAVLRISSGYQVHPVIATRWAGFLKHAALEVVMCANEGYLPGMVNFSCRVARCAREREKKRGDDGEEDTTEKVDIIRVLEEYASRAKDPTLRQRMGESFARGHKEASGGIVPIAEFEELIEVLEIGAGRQGKAKESEREGTASKVKTSPKSKGQANTLMNYFGKS